MLQSAIDYAGLTDKIRVWFYPEDFGIPFNQPAQKFIDERKVVVQTNGQYSYNKSSGIRHNSRCTYFSCQSSCQLQMIRGGLVGNAVVDVEKLLIEN